MRSPRATLRTFTPAREAFWRPSPSGYVEVGLVEGYIRAMAGRAPSDRNVEAGIRLVLEELRDVRVEMRDVRVEMRDMRVEMRADRRRADEERRQFAGEPRQANQRFERILRDFRQDSSRREA